MKIHVPEMSCGHCTAAITKKIAELDPEATVSTDLPQRTVVVETAKADSAVIDAIKAAGFDAAAV